MLSLLSLCCLASDEVGTGYLTAEAAESTFVVDAKMVSSAAEGPNSSANSTANAKVDTAIKMYGTGLVLDWS